MLDFVNSDAFTFRELVTGINRIPFEPRQIMSLGIFQEERKTSDLVAVEVMAGVINLLKETSRHGTPEGMVRDKGELFPFQIKARKQSDTLNADEIFRAREFGTEDQRKTIERERDKVLAKMRRNHDATREQRFAGALFGIMYDSDGVTPLHNYWQELNLAKPPIEYMNLAAAANGDLMDKHTKMVRGIRKSLGGTVPSGVHVLAREGYIDAFVKNAEVRDSYRDFQTAAWLRQGKVFSAFGWGPIFIEEWRGAPTFIGINQAIAFPLGVPDMYLECIAPAPWLDTVGTLGIPYYAKAAVDPKFQAYVEIESQSHTLAIVTRPDAIRILDAAASA